MKKRFVIVAAVGLVVLLAACAQATTLPEAEATDTPTAAVKSPTVSSPATATPVPEATEIVPEPAAAFPTPNPNPECVAAPIPEDPNIPQATADEWSQGPDDAPITLIEYGDFQ